NFHRRSQQAVGVGEVVSRLAHRFHHREATGYFLQHRLDGSLLGSEGERSAKLFRVHAELGKRRHPNQRNGIGRLHDLQRRHGVAHLRRVEKIDALDVHGNIAMAKFGEHLIAIGMSAVQHCDVVKIHRRVLLMHGRYGVGDELRFLLAAVVQSGLHRRCLRQGRVVFETRAAQRLTRPAAIVQLFAGNGRIDLNGLIGATQDGRSRAAVLRQRGALHPAGVESLQKLVEGPAGGAAETIDRLVGIADREYVCLLPPKQLGQLNLGDVGVLELVDQNEAGIFLRALQHRLTAAEQIDRARDDVAEGSQSFLLQQVLYIMEDPRDLATALEHLLVQHRRGVFRLPYALQRNLAALQTSDVGVVVLRSAQLVMATAEEFQQMLEELSRIGRLDETLERQILNAASQQDLQVFLVEQRKLNVGVAQQSVAIGMKGVRPTFNLR